VRPSTRKGWGAKIGNWGERRDQKTGKGDKERGKRFRKGGDKRGGTHAGLYPLPEEKEKKKHVLSSQKRAIVGVRRLDGGV